MRQVMQVKKPKKLTNGEKVTILAESEEMKQAAGLMIALFHDCKLKSHLRLTYMVDGQLYELTMIPLDTKTI